MVEGLTDNRALVITLLRVAAGAFCKSDWPMRDAVLAAMRSKTDTDSLRSIALRFNVAPQTLSDKVIAFRKHFVAAWMAEGMDEMEFLALLQE
jgi:hypothetical protein